MPKWRGMKKPAAKAPPQAEDGPIYVEHASLLNPFGGSSSQVAAIPDHQLLRCIGRGSYGEVWLARNVLGDYRAVKIVYREKFADDRPFEREFEGIRNFEPISRTHESQVDILHV